MCAAGSDPGVVAPAGPLERHALTRQGALWIEGADTLLTQFRANSVEVAPDGRAFVAWLGGVLTLVDLRTGTSRPIPTDADERESSVAWSCDGQALLITGRKGRAAGIVGFAPPPEYTAIRLIDLRTGTKRELARFANEAARPLAWSARSRLAAIAISPPGQDLGGAYVRVGEDGATRRWELPKDQYWALSADPAARQVVAQMQGGVRAILRWPLEDGGAMTRFDPQPSESISRFSFVAGSPDVLVVVRSGGTDQLVRWSSARTPLASPGPAPGLFGTEVIPRADGSVYVLRTSLDVGHVETLLLAPDGSLRPVATSTMVPDPERSLILSIQAESVLRPPVLTPGVPRHQAISTVTAQTDRVLRVDRTDAKLGEWRDLAGRASLRSSQPADLTVWAVVVAGRIEALSGTQRIPLRWGVWAIDATSGAILDFATEGIETWVWPRWWDAIVDRSPDPPRRSLPVPGRGPHSFLADRPCGAAGGPARDGDRYIWLVDCTPELNRDAVNTLGPMLERQRWTRCPGTPTPIWRKDDVMTEVGRATTFGLEYLTITQRMRAAGEC